MKAKKLFFGLILILTVISASLMLESAVSVQTVSADSEIVVNSAADVVDDDGVCTLREAIISANTDNPSGVIPGECIAGTGADIISFEAGYTITLDGDEKDLPVYTPISITGKSPASTIIQRSACNPVDPVDCTPAIVGYSIMEIANSGVLNLSGLTLRHNYASSGGAIRNRGTLTVDNSVITANKGHFYGGGILNEMGGTITITNSTLASNWGEYGGGIYNDVDCSLTINSSTISNNSTWVGGGISNAGGSVMVINSTLSENSALYGGGIISISGGDVNLINSSLIANIGGGVYNDTGSVLRYINTIIAQSTSGDDCSADSIHPDSTHNLVMDGSCGNIDINNLKLGPLADNGGPTLTHALLPGSPAIDAGNPAVCVSSLVKSADQRGISRPYGAECDIGAYEFNGFLGLFYLPMILK